MPPPPPSTNSSTPVDLSVLQVNQAPTNVNPVNHPVLTQLPAVQSAHVAHLSTLEENLQHSVSQFMPPILSALNPWVDMHQQLSGLFHASRSVVQPPVPPWALNPPLFGPVYLGFCLPVSSHLFQ